MIFRSAVPDIEIPSLGVYQYATRNVNGIDDNKPVYIDAVTGAELTFGALKRDSKRLAAGLQDKLDLKKGGVVAILSPNQVDYAVVFFGVIAAGGIPTLASPQQTPKDFQAQLYDSTASIIIVHPLILATALETAKNCKFPLSKIFLFGGKEIDGIRPYTDLLGDREAEPVVFTEKELKEQPAFLCYSSGTTGRQKGVMTTHYNAVANFEQYKAVEEIKMHSGLVLLGFLPFFHIYGLNAFVNTFLSLGATVVVIPKFDLTLFCTVIQKYKVNIAHIVPPIVLLLTKSPVARTFDFSSVQVFISGAAPLSESLANEFYDIYKVPIKQGYGLTETSPVTHLGSGSDPIFGSVGKLCPNLEAKIISEDGKELGYNKPGELCLRGPNIMKGYWKNKEATDACFDSEGFFHTGDIAIVANVVFSSLSRRQDENGNFFIIDRLKELIKYKGFQVAPAELEALLLTHKSIADAAVIGVWSYSEATEYPIAYVQVKPGIEQTDELKRDIQKYVADNAAPYKKLRGGVVFIDQVPKSASGKILRKLLRSKSQYKL
ncbi:1214_t:CDS:10 [Paraglomus brasilianum]|uniref:1214_t:CDS:1 n=1 Tax=Paraglomus brasilianum TaxID=144538 RepID=A0A9N9FC96_9GLOM|nr:1214_t:CDS:10 [Paraglomus brasilianum]